MCIHSIPKLGVDKTMFWRLEGWNPIYSGNGKLSPERIFQFPTQSLVSDHFWKSGEVGTYLGAKYMYLKERKIIVCEKKIKHDKTKSFSQFPNTYILVLSFGCKKMPPFGILTDEETQPFMIPFCGVKNIRFNLNWFDLCRQYKVSRQESK